MMTGAMTACSLSTNPASKNEPRMTPPPSTSSERTSRPASSRSKAARSTRPPSLGSSRTSAPAARREERQGSGAPFRVAIRVRAGPPRTRAMGGVRPRLSTTTRRGWRSASLPPGRAVSNGSSTTTVEEPTRMASTFDRRSWAHSRASGPDTQRESPEAAAIRPSREAANLAMTNGIPFVRCLMNASLMRRASASPSPAWTAMPAASSFRRPPPSTLGSGSAIE